MKTLGIMIEILVKIGFAKEFFLVNYCKLEKNRKLKKYLNLTNEANESVQ